jgi:hypothetical protein
VTPTGTRSPGTTWPTELGDPNRTFLQYDYLAGREELLAGERLYLDVKRMELAYDELNRREYELTKHVSLRQVDPRALMELRTTGQCTVDLPEELFDLDCPGHYFRRLRSVAVSIPCIAGPCATVACTQLHLGPVDGADLGQPVMRRPGVLRPPPRPVPGTSRAP